MEVIPWILAVLFGILAAYLAFRPRTGPYPDALARLTEEVGKGGPLDVSAPGDPPEVLDLRRALRSDRRPVPDPADQPMDLALRGLFRYLDKAVLAPLERAAQTDHGSNPQILDAVDALKDLEFYAREPGEEPRRIENLTTVVQSVIREYSLATGVPVRLSGPPEPLPIHVAPEGFRDALYLLFSNAGRFGKESKVDVVAEVDGDRVRLAVRDRGPGFSSEALDRAFEPFWTTDQDALGLGLTHARRLFERQGMRLDVSNRDGGGGEAVIQLQRAWSNAGN